MIEKETKQVDIKIGNETKSVTISRYGEGYCWTALVPVLVRFPTGRKVHLTFDTTAHERKDGTYFLQAAGYRNSQVAKIFAWHNGELATSKWRG